ncbi:MAG: NAD(P)/FAD-dependent oxidoreductase [Desulfurococcales archaeon]|nr:NAD(P)/FAD-dependent oxidoreductase [Desulfurococcales archaeon]
MKIAVVGGGFAGLLFAYKLAAKGYDVDLYEEHSRVGFPKHCTGLVSSRTVELIGEPAQRNIISRYKGVILETGSSKCVIETIDDVIKLDRVELEEDLRREAEAGGAKIYMKTRVESVKPDGSLSLGGQTRTYDLVFLAEGIHGRLRHSLGLEWRPLTTYGYNIEVEAPNTSDNSEYIVIEFRRGLAGFAWRVPLPRGTLYGALSRNPRQSKRILEEAMLGGSPADVYGGVVVHGPPLERPRLGRVVIVGDAAGLNKPLTGGGLYPNSLLADLIASRDLASGDYHLIDEATSEVVGLLSRQFRIARAYYSSPDRGYRVLDVILRGGFCESLSGRLTYDGHEALVSTLLSSPSRLFKLLFRVLSEGVSGDAGALLAYYLGLKKARM